MDATNSIATDLFYKIRSRFSGLKLGTAQGTITISPEQARFFDFDYMDGENPIGHVSISLAEENSMKVYFSTGITESMDDPQKYKWYGFLKELRQFAKRRLMAFDTRDIAKDNLDKRDFAFLAQYNKPQPQNDQQIVKPVGENIMSESTMYGTRTMSYQKLMDTRLIIKHSHALVDDQQPGARTRNISALFVENHDGERFKYPFIHLAGARAMQRHVANSGLPYDDVGKSIINMSEEIAQLKSFSNYVVRNDLMNSDTNDLIIRSQDRLNSLREQIAKIAKQKHYESYVESFEAQAPVEVPQEIVEQFKDQFTIKSFKENIASVFPILYKLSQETSLGYDDIVAETNINDQAEVIEESEFENRLDRFESWILGLGEASAIQSPDEDEQSQAAKNLQELVSQHFPAGVDGTNAIESLKGIIEDPELFKEIKNQAKEDPDGCVRPLVKSWLEDNAPEVLDQLDFGDMVDEPVDGQTSSEEEPQMAGDDPDERNKDRKDDLPFDADYKDGPPSAKDEFGNTIKHRARHLARKGMRQAMDVKELAEFISSFYDRDTGKFPKGPEGVVTMVGKKFGEQAEQVARKFVERMAPHQEQGAEQMQELARIRELSGMRPLAQEQISNEAASPKMDWSSDDVVTVKTKMGDYYVKDTPEGLMLMGEDVEGYFHSDQDGESREGYIDFVYNMDTGKMVESPDDWHDDYGYLSYDDVEEFVKEVTQEVKSKYGETYDEIKDEVEGSVSVEKESTVAEDGDDLEDLRAELRDAYKMMYDSASEGIDQTDHIADELGEFFDAVEESGDESIQQGYEMVRGTADTDPEEQAEALRKAMRLLDPPEPDVGIDRESFNHGVNESSDDIYTIPNPDMERDAETGREEPDEIEVKVEFSSYDDEFEIDKVIRLDTKEDITDKVSNDRQLYFNLVYDVQQREQGRERDYNESIRDDVTPELEAIKRLSGITQGLGL
jgi:hypothetical protein